MCPVRSSRESGYTVTEPFEFAAALAATGAQWWLVREAAASTALDRDETHSLDDASTICDRCGRHLPCRHCPPAGDDGLTDEERNERLEQWQATYAARPNPMEIAAARARYTQGLTVELSKCERLGHHLMVMGLARCVVCGMDPRDTTGDEAP